MIHCTYITRLTSRLRASLLLVTAVTQLALVAACAESIEPSSVADDLLEGQPSAPGGKTDDASRASAVLEALTQWNAHLSAADRDNKFAKMAESAFAFYRGSNHLFWADLAADARLSEFGNGYTVAWLQGDMHTSNVGAFHTDEGEIIYDLNDFDEAVWGDYQVDVWRMATSLVLVGRQNRLSSRAIRTGVDAFTEAYLDAIEDYAGSQTENDVAFTADNTSGQLDNFLRDVAEDGSREELLDKWTTTSNGARQFDPDEEKLAPVDQSTRDAISAAFASYGETLSGNLAWDEDYFAIKDVAARLDAGIGSLGSLRYYVLIEGPSGDSDDDIILDVKQQGTPTGAYFLADGASQADWFSSPAERVVRSQRALLDNADDHLGWLSVDGVSFSVRERSPWDETFDDTALTSGSAFATLAQQWGMVLATAHARADVDFDSDLMPWSLDDEVYALIDGNHDEFRSLVWQVASSYATQVEADYQVFLSTL